MKPWERVWAATTQDEMAALWNEIGPFTADLKAAADARLSDPSTPRCRMCVLPKRAGGPYCGGYSCGNAERVCQRCGALFAPRVDGASSKYCSRECLPGRSPSQVTDECCRCGKLGRRVERLWPYVCVDCRYPLRYAITALRNHHVPWEMVTRLFDNPGCDICGENILGQSRHTGMAARSDLCVDHDHKCCSTGPSCGKCVRGFLCTHCNKGIGHMSDDAEKLRRAANYLDRWYGNG
jgi:Recombination endonuclease VII.